MISKSRVSVLWNALVSSSAMAASIRWLSSLIGFLKSLITRDPVAERAEDVVLEAQRLAAVGTDQLLLDQIDHAGLELVDQVVDRGVGIVEVPAHRLVGGHSRGHP